MYIYLDKKIRKNQVQTNLNFGQFLKAKDTLLDFFKSQILYRCYKKYLKVWLLMQESKTLVLFGECRVLLKTISLRMLNCDVLKKLGD